MQEIRCGYDTLGEGFKGWKRLNKFGWERVRFGSACSIQVVNKESYRKMDIQVPILSTLVSTIGDKEAEAHTQQVE